jgi:hypothetical protein
VADDAVGERPANGRDARGRFTGGNSFALVHGGRSRQVAAGQLPEQVDALAVLADREAAIVNELGGPEAISQIRRDLVTRYLETSTIADYLAANILANGVLTTKGRTRAAVTVYLQVIDRLHRLGVSIGLERRPKPAQSLADVLAQHEESAQ